MKKKIDPFIERTIVSALSFLKDSLFCGHFASKKGFLQARDPRIKTVSLLLVIISVLFARRIDFVLSIYALCLLLVKLCGIDLKFFLRRTWFFMPVFSLIIALPAVFNAFTPGHPLAQFRIFGAFLVVTREGINIASLFFIRVLTCVSWIVLLGLTTGHTALLKVMRVFKIPDIYVMIIGMSYRYIYLLIETVQNTYTAIKSRVGYVASIKKGQRMAASSIAGIWQRSYALHNDIYLAMLSRGYACEPVISDDFSSNAGDWYCLSLAVLVLIASLWLK